MTLVAAPIGIAQTQKASSKPVPSGHTMSDEELTKIQRRFDQIATNHQNLLKALDDIKAELTVIKVRVTNR